MKHSLKLIAVLAAISLSAVNTISAKVWINEFMQSNIDGIRDDLHEFPDSWVELYNDENVSVSIYNWYISEKKDYTKGWRITQDVKVPAKGYLLIYCDKVGDKLHADFRLESADGGAIYLFDAQGKAVDQVTDIIKQPAPGISCGRIEDASANWGYFIDATPNKKNQGKTSEVLPPSPIFETEGGVFKSAVSLTLSIPETAPDIVSKGKIYYTTDGTEPTIYSKRYEKPIDIKKSTSVRAKILADGCLVNRSRTHTYIITNRNFDLPIVSITINPEFLFDDEFGIYVKGNGKYGKKGNCVDYNANWNQNWRRPMNFEYFPSQDSKSVLNQLEELRIAGGCSREYAQKSFVLYSNKRFGEKYYDYQLFKDKPGQKIKSFMLRNSGNDFWYTHFRDAAMQLLIGGKADLDYQAYQPAVLYINGEYRGIQNLRERSEDDFVMANYNGLEDIDMLENWSEVKAGDKTAYKEMTDKVKDAQTPYSELEKLIDINEVINYYILQIYVGNTDFPNNNVVIWRSRQEGGKWRLILKDTDFGFGLYDSNPNINAFAHNNKDEWGRELFRGLMKHAEFKEEFSKRFAIYLGDIFHSNQSKHLIDSLQQNLKHEMYYHIERWKPEVWWRDMNAWQSEVDKIRNWTSKRNNYVYTQMKTFFRLSGLSLVKVEIPNEISGTTSLAVNGIKLHSQAFDGKYITGQPFNLSWRGEEGANFVGWRVDASVNSKLTTTELIGKDVAYTIPTGCTKVQFTALSQNMDIDNTQVNDVVIIGKNNEILISNLTGDSRVVVFDSTGIRIKQVASSSPTISIPLTAKGIYVVSVYTKEKKITEKVVL